ncbi:hypothetical protein E8E13_000589 [Curvularia kusanoi]|uniref:Alpha/beta hydrolase fold-3 domain-containing protein n=1 Tax=Curvularia kusanoi TaxID=90978 RepID=A0A9P4W7T5_CURKU|nr:hypothetical protein E8E13_000589 [Curvularia kusanoi]
MASSWSALGVRLYIQHVRRSKQIFGNAQNIKDSMHELYNRPQSFTPPANTGPDIIVERADVTDWPLYRVSLRRSPGETPLKGPQKAMLYLHGGAFYREIESAHWAFIFQAARQTGLTVFVPIYPLVPRPSATAQQIVPALVDLCRHIKDDIVNITGDSAGGCLALATTQHMQDIAPSQAAKLTSVVLISPVLDITFSHPEIERLDKLDPWLGLEGLRSIIPLYAGELPTSDPIVSPLFGDIERLPPVLLLSGTHDMLNADARRLSARFQGENSDECVPGGIQSERFTYVEQADMIHVYPLLPHWEGRQARDLIMEFVQSHLQ